MMRFMIYVLFLLMFPLPAMAAEYPAGSIGYVYERCRADLKDSRSEDVFQKTYCGQFFAGFFPAWLGSNMIMLLKVPDDQPCKVEMEKAHKFVLGKQYFSSDKINRMFEEYKTDKFMVYVNFFEGIISSFESEGRIDEVFSQPAVMSWKYFYTLDPKKNPEEIKNRKFEVHPDLLSDKANIDTTASEQDYMLKGSFSAQETYDLCFADLINARGAEEKFSETVCSAGIYGTLTGLIWNKRMESRESVEGECKETIDQFFDQFNIEKQACISDKIRTIDVATVFIDAANNDFPNSDITKKDNKIDWTALMHTMSRTMVAFEYKSACKWKDLPPFDYNKYRTYNE